MSKNLWQLVYSYTGLVLCVMCYPSYFCYVDLLFLMNCSTFMNKFAVKISSMVNKGESPFIATMNAGADETPFNSPQILT